LAKSSAAENSDRTSTYTITFTHHQDGRLGSGMGLV